MCCLDDAMLPDGKAFCQSPAIPNVSGIKALVGLLCGFAGQKTG
jgi:hypothetical protein